MTIQIIWWYPSNLQRVIPVEIEIGDDKHFKNMEHLIQYLNGFGLYVAFPKDFSTSHQIMVDEQFFYQR